MRSLLLIPAMCLGLIACGQGTPSAMSDLAPNNILTKFWNKQAQEQGLCPNVGELTMGMTTKEVVAACKSSPRNVMQAQTVGGEREEWYYKGGYLTFENGRLARIQREQ
jgi:hypothetical protein